MATGWVFHELYLWHDTGTYAAVFPPSLTIEAIQREVASYFGVKLHDLKGPKRHRAVSHPRMVAMSWPGDDQHELRIGSRFGARPGTVISAVRKSVPVRHRRSAT
jgi:chromosomal replication initiator protein